MLSFSYYYYLEGLNTKARESKLARQSFLVVGKPLIIDEQIESHAESYICLKSVPLRNCPPWHTTRVDYTTHP